MARMIRLGAIGAVVVGVVFATAIGTPWASATGVWWGATSGARPSVLPENGAGELILSVEDRGVQAADGASAPIRIVDTLPQGVTAVSSPIYGANVGSNTTVVQGACAVNLSKTVVSCEVKASVATYHEVEVKILVSVAEKVSGEGRVSVSGGGAAGTVTSPQRVTVGEETPFGFEGYELLPEEAGGASVTQAGKHPFQVTTVLGLNQVMATFEKGGKRQLEPVPVRLPKDIVTQWPAGLVGDPSAVEDCSEEQFVREEVRNGIGTLHNECQANTAVGVATVTFDDPGTIGLKTINVPVFALTPQRGEPARLGFEANGPVYLDVSVRTGGDYGVTAESHDITQLIGFLGARITVWGVPSDPRHDGQRGWECIDEGVSSCPVGSGSHLPFLMMPTSCEEPFVSSISGDSWPSQGPEGEPLASFAATTLSYTAPQGVDGCDRLQFEPSIEVAPDVPEASASTGLAVHVKVSQKGALTPEGLAEAAPRDITVALPEGVAVNPSGGDGLQGCSEGLIGYEGTGEVDPGVITQRFTPSLPSPLAPGVNFCPNGAKIGTITIHTPLLPKPLTGYAYLASQNENPFGSLIAVYLVAEDAEAGTLVKLAGEPHLTASGQLVTTFKNSPQVPFEEVELHFFGGERAPLATPAHCGSYETTASFVPWASDEPKPASSTFQITRGLHGASCPGTVLPFSPFLTGGTTNINAGSFSPLTTTIGREDGQQDLQAVQLHMPPGLSGLLANVKLCPEAQANAGTCGSESLIGETTVSAGVGSDPVSVTGGKVYITEKYAGAPFGLSIVNPVKAGPFDLEHDTSNPAQNPACDCLVVRAKIEIDPHTAALTVTTDTSGPHAIPHIIDGVPVQIRKVNVTINRPGGFTFNPTSCEPMQITGMIGSDTGASVPVSVPFHVANCATLGFAPKFSAATNGKTNKANGASLTVKLAYPTAPFGTQANIAMVKVELPVQLPSRLTTLQKACTAAQFASNPAGCPAASIVGHAKAITPLLPVPLEGPAYFVSNGSEAFPNLIMVLQGYGVTIDLVGDTFISKTGVTSSTFKTVPDAPVGSFEVTLPQGPDSALAANVNLCALAKTVTVKKRVKVRVHGRERTVTRKVKQQVATSLGMPTELTAQNGDTLHQITKIAVTECPKHKAKTTGKKQRKKKRR